MKLCLRAKDSLTCTEGGKPCSNKYCTIAKMGYKAEDFEDTPTQQKIKDVAYCGDIAVCKENKNEV